MFQVLLKSSYFFLSFFVFFKANSASFTRTLHKSVGENVEEVCQVEVFFGSQIEPKSKREISEGHQVANWLHYVPREIVESSQ